MFTHPAEHLFKKRKRWGGKWEEHTHKPVNDNSVQSIDDSSSSSEDPTCVRKIKKKRSMADLYENTQILDFEDMADYALFIDADVVTFEEAF